MDEIRDPRGWYDGYATHAEMNRLGDDKNDDDDKEPTVEGFVFVDTEDYFEEDEDDMPDDMCEKCHMTEYEHLETCDWWYDPKEDGPGENEEDEKPPPTDADEGWVRVPGKDPTWDNWEEFGEVMGPKRRKRELDTDEDE